MQVINFIDTLFDLPVIADRYTRLSLSVLFWAIGRVVIALTSRRAIRIYSAIIGAFLYACQSAIESGRIVRQGYNSVDHTEHAEVIHVECEPNQELTVALDGSWTVTDIAPISNPTDSEHLPTSSEHSKFIDELLSIADDETDQNLAQLWSLQSLSIRTLRSLCSLEGFVGASRFKKTEAIDCLWMS